MAIFSSLFRLEMRNSFYTQKISHPRLPSDALHPTYLLGCTFAAARSIFHKCTRGHGVRLRVLFVLRVDGNRGCGFTARVVLMTVKMTSVMELREKIVWEVPVISLVACIILSCLIRVTLIVIFILSIPQVMNTIFFHRIPRIPMVVVVLGR